jgi:UDP-N-acetylmuramate--L-alanine ligase/UDP-N-acetylenolpyruvoylglucosamine reductase
MTNSPTVHLIGMGGIGMSALAKMYLSMGYWVQGSDVKKNEILCELEKMGAKVLIGHEEGHVSGANLVVYSSSIAREHPERSAALRQGLRLIHRSEALAQFCRGKYTVAVTGTHGKTTTTAMVGMILKEAGRDPSVVVGGVVHFFGGNACIGEGHEMVIEADESDASFLNFSPNLEIVTNIEEEHMDHYKTLDAILGAYESFVQKLPPEGVWLGCGDDFFVRQIAARNLRPAILYGFNSELCQIYATDVVECPQGERGVSFNAWQNGHKLGAVRMRLIGRHNVLNALAALGAGLRLGVSFQTAATALGKYQGAGRRFDVCYEDERFMVVDDYAHHPTEIEQTLLAAKGLGRKRIVAVFQPHRYTRTQALLEKFGGSFSSADKLFVTDIYAAGEAPIPGIAGQTVCEAVREAGHPDVSFVERFHLAPVISSEMKPGDLVIVLGAGDVSQVAAQIASALKAQVFSEIRGKVLQKEPLSRHTSLKIGGPIDFWIEPEDWQDLRKVLEVCRKENLKVHLFGGGNNLLAPEEGLKGVGICLNAPAFRKILLKDGVISAGAGTAGSLLIQFALEHGFGGCEFLSGIPGCVGGLVAMNAGSHGESIDALVRSVTLMDWEGHTRILLKDQIPFSYRSSGIKEGILVEVEFALPKSTDAQTLQKLDEYHQYRQKTQDLQHPSAGCMFKNPNIPGCSSGQLIDQAGLKGKRIGNAQISEKHANFIINLGGASSQDVLALIREAKLAVKEKFDVDLEVEVKIL